MKTTVLHLIYTVVLIGAFAFAQDPAPAPQPAQVQNIYAFGVSYNQGSSPQVAGTALWAHSVSGSGTFAFTVVDILPLGYHPFAVTTNVGVGVAQKVLTVHGLDVYGSGSAGVSLNGSNTGWAWTTGALISVPVKSGKYHLMPNVRVLKSSVGNGAGYQPIIGILLQL